MYWTALGIGAAIANKSSIRNLATLLLFKSLVQFQTTIQIFSSIVQNEWECDSSSINSSIIVEAR
jgi:hypothetical protein